MKKVSQGFTLIEMIIYMVILGVVMTAVVQILFSSTRSMSDARLERRIFYTAEAAMETLIRDVRQSSDVLLASSSFGTNPGVLALRTVSAPGGSAVITRIFSLSSGHLTKNDGGIDEFLTSSEVRITDLTFWHETATSSSLVTFKMTVESGDQKSLKNHTFYGSAILRAKY